MKVSSKSLVKSALLRHPLSRACSNNMLPERLLPLSAFERQIEQC